MFFRAHFPHPLVHHHAGGLVIEALQVEVGRRLVQGDGRTAQMFARPGEYSKIRFSMPSSSKIALKNLAAFTSLPGGLVVSICRYFCIHSTARSE